MNMLNNSNTKDINKVHTELLERTTLKSERKNMLDCRLVIAEEKTSELEHTAMETTQNETKTKYLALFTVHNSKIVSESWNKVHNVVEVLFNTMERKCLFFINIWLYRLVSLYNLSIDHDDTHRICKTCHCYRALSEH